MPLHDQPNPHTPPAQHPDPGAQEFDISASPPSSPSSELQPPEWTLVRREGADVSWTPLASEGIDLRLRQEPPLFSILPSELSKNGTLVSVASATIDPDEKILICIPGLLADGEKASHIHGFLKFAGSFIDDAQEVRVIATGDNLPFGLSDAGSAPWEKYAANYGESFDHSVSDESVELAKAVLLPRIISRDADGGISRVPYPEMLARFDKVTFFAHCAGSSFAQEVANSVSLLGQQLGYTKSEMEEAISHLGSVNISSIVPNNKAPNKMAAAYLQPDNDPLARGFADCIRAATQADGIVIRQFGNAPLALVTGIIPSTITYLTEAGRERTVDLSQRADYPDYVAHDLRLFRYQGVKEPNAFAEAAKTTLQLMLARNGPLSVADFYSCLQSSAS